MSQQKKSDSPISGAISRAMYIIGFCVKMDHRNLSTRVQKKENDYSMKMRMKWKYAHIISFLAPNNCTMVSIILSCTDKLTPTAAIPSISDPD